MNPALVAALVALAPGDLPYEPTGEVLIVPPGASASFSSDRVVGPVVNLTRMEGGYWAGDILGQNVQLEVTDRAIRGPNFDVHIERKKGAIVVRGNVFATRINVEFGPKEIEGRMGACSIDLAKKRPGIFSGQIGCQRGGLPAVTGATMKLAGDAAAEEPPLPQLAFALIAVLPG